MWSVFRHEKRDRCAEVMEFLSSYLDERLSSRERELVESHLEGCEKCREEFDSLRETVGLLHRLPMVSVPRSFAIPQARAAPGFVAVPRARAVPRPTLFGALRTATAVAAIFLAVVFAVDMAYPSPVAAPAGAQYPGASSEMGQIASPTPLPTSEVSAPASGAAGGREVMTGPAGMERAGATTSPAEGTVGVPWLMHSLEMGLLGLVVMLAGFTIVLWRKGRDLPSGN